MIVKEPGLLPSPHERPSRVTDLLTRSQITKQRKRMEMEEMDSQTGEIEQVKRATAMAVSSIVMALRQTDPLFEERFIALIERHYQTVRNEPTATALHGMELLSWIKAIVTTQKS
jgi:hypothetical protein